MLSRSFWRIAGRPVPSKPLSSRMSTRAFGVQKGATLVNPMTLAAYQAFR